MKLLQGLRAGEINVRSGSEAKDRELDGGGLRTKAGHESFADKFGVEVENCRVHAENEQFRGLLVFRIALDVAEKVGAANAAESGDVRVGSAAQQQDEGEGCPDQH